MSTPYSFLQPSELEKAAIKAVYGLQYNIAEFGIIDRLEHSTGTYIMLNYNSDNLSRENSKVLSLRGVILHVENQVVVCASYGYTPDVISNTMNVGSNIQDSLGNNVESYFNDPDVTYTPALEGTVVRYWLYKGSMFISTNRKIWPVNSKFGKSLAFLELLRILDGPSKEDLFGNEFLSSYITHCFMICHPDLTVTSKNNTGDGFLVYLGPLVNPRNGVLDPNIDDSTRYRAFVQQIQPDENSLGYPDGQDKMYIPSTLNKREANEVLTYGPCFFAKKSIDAVRLSINPNLATGEPVLAIKRDSNGRIASMVRIVPSSFLKRINITKQDPVPLHRVSEIFDESRGYTDTYRETFPALCAPTMSQFSELKILFETMNIYGPLPGWPLVSEFQLANGTHDLRFRNALFWYILSLPIEKQAEACDYYASFENRKEIIYNYIMNNLPTLIKIFVTKELPARKENLAGYWWDANGNAKPATKNLSRLVVTAARGNPSQAHKAGNAVLSREMIESNLKNLLENEHGATRYQLSQAITNSTKA